MDISTIWRALYCALLNDLEPIEYHPVIWSSKLGRQTENKDEICYRRPYEHEVEVYSFPQSFSDTTLGFGGVGGQAFTTAQMTVVIYGANACVYVSGKLAYKLKRYTTKFWEDLNQHYLLGRNSNWNKLYAAEV